MATVASLAAAAQTSSALARGRYSPSEASLSGHSAPKWWQDAKLGIFIHWGIYSVPAFAPREALEITESERGSDKAMNPYAEWYQNTLLIANSPTEAFHRNAYGDDFNYYEFARTFNKAVRKWSPDKWATLFKSIGAGYVVLTSKHHDGFTLWPSTTPNPKLPRQLAGSKRDLVGELSAAVRRRGLRMGLYYSGLYDWSFKPGPLMEIEQTKHSSEYVSYADRHWRELIRRYSPDILWNDIGYSPNSDVLTIVADYYNSHPQGVINNRWEPFKIGDFATPEYMQLDEISKEPWETCRGLGKSFGLNRIEGPEETIKPADLVHLLVDVVSKNGNLLLNVGPEPDGTIPAIQLHRLQELGSWLRANGEAIFNSRPWTRFSGSTAEGGAVRFTRSGGALNAILLEQPTGAKVVLLDLPGYSQATLLASKAKLKTRRVGSSLEVELPSELPGSYAWAIRLE
jgi:alpha-L-fucosidase